MDHGGGCHDARNTAGDFGWCPDSQRGGGETLGAWLGGGDTGERGRRVCGGGLDTDGGGGLDLVQRLDTGGGARFAAAGRRERAVPGLAGGGGGRGGRLFAASIGRTGSIRSRRPASRVLVERAAAVHGAAAALLERAAFPHRLGVVRPVRLLPDHPRWARQASAVSGLALSGGLAHGHAGVVRVFLACWPRAPEAGTWDRCASRRSWRRCSGWRCSGLA